MNEWTTGFYLQAYNWHTRNFNTNIVKMPKVTIPSFLLFLQFTLTMNMSDKIAQLQVTWYFFLSMLCRKIIEKNLTTSQSIQLFTR